MQTFLTHFATNTDEVFRTTARSLDYRRLGKQRVEALQIMNALTGKSKGWVNHPATRMWRGHESILAVYHNHMIFEWKRRGYTNNMPFMPASMPPPMPEWFTPELVESHRSNLVRKDAAHYGKLWPGVSPDLEYVWPK